MRAFIFTVMFAALFFLLLVDASLYLRSRGEEALSEANQSAVDTPGMVMDDLSSDLMEHLGTGVQSGALNASNKTNITFSDTIPSLLADPGTEFSQWANFTVNGFARETNMNITMNTTGFTARPCLQTLPYNLSYCYSSLAKYQLVVNGSSVVSNYSISMRLNRAVNFTNDTNWSWSGVATSLYVTLDVQDGAGSQISVKNQTSGYVNATIANSFLMQGQGGGTLNVEAGSLPGLGAPALRITPSAISARTTTSVLLNGTPPVTVYAPIFTRVGEQQSNLIVWRG